MAREKSSSTLSVEQVLLGIAATSTLVLAAFVSGLPGAVCTAMAQSYSLAIWEFGASALVAALTACCLAVVDKYWTASRIRGICLLPSACVFLGTILMSGGNLNDATVTCGVGSDGERGVNIDKTTALRSLYDPTTWLVPYKPIR